MDRTATAPVEVRTSVVAGLFLGGEGLSSSISVVAIVTLMHKVGRYKVQGQSSYNILNCFARCSRHVSVFGTSGVRRSNNRVLRGWVSTRWR